MAASDTDPTRPQALRTIDLGAILGVAATAVGTLVLIGFARRLEQVAEIVILAVTLAVLAAPIARRLGSPLGTNAAVVATAAGVMAALIGLAAVVFADLRHQAGEVADRIAARLDDVRQGSLVDRLVDALRLDDAVERWLEQVPSLVLAGEASGRGLATQVLALLLVVVLMAFVLASGGTIRDWVVARWPRDTADRQPRRELRSLLDDVDRTGIAYVRRTLVLGTASGLVVGSIAFVAGLPGAVVLGVWAGAWLVVPVVGSIIGLAPIAMLAVLDGDPTGAVAFAATLVVALGAMGARTRWIERPTLKLGVGVHVLGVAFGVALGGIAASVVGLVVAAATAAWMRSRHRPGRPAPWLVDADQVHRIGRIDVPRGWRGALVVAGAATSGVLMWIGLARLGTSVAWFLVGGFVAIALAAPVAFLTRRFGVPRPLAAGVLLTGIAAILVTVVVVGADDGARATTTVTERLPEIVGDLETAPVVGPVLADREASVWMAERLDDLPRRLATGDPAEWLPALGARILDLFWIGVIAVALLVDGPRVFGAIERRVPAHNRRQYVRLTRATARALSGYAAGAALVAAINGTVVFTTAVLLGIGLAPVLALWAFGWNFVPQIGGFMGGLPLVLFGLVQGPGVAALAGVIFFAYQLVENHLVQPAVIGAAIDIAPWGTLLAALAGATAAGVVGAIVVTPLVGVARVVRAEYLRDDFPGATRTPHHPSNPS